MWTPRSNEGPITSAPMSYLDTIKERKKLHKGDEITLLLNPEHLQYEYFRKVKRGDSCTISVNGSDASAVLVSKYKNRLTFSVS